MKWRKLEKSKYESKAEHIRKLRLEEQEKILETCPREINEFAKLKIFSKSEMDKLKKEEVIVNVIGKVELDSDEIAILKLPPKFAIRKKLDDLDMRTDMEMAAAKIRYQTHKEDAFRDIEIDDEIEDMETFVKKRKLLTTEELEELKKHETLDFNIKRVHTHTYPSNRSLVLLKNYSWGS